KAGEVSELFNTAGRSTTVTATHARPVEGELSVGHVFSSAWAIFSANIGIFLAIGLIVALPNLIALMLAPAETIPPANPPLGTDLGAGAVGLGFVGGILAVVLTLVSQAVILYVAFQYLRGQPVTLGDAVQKGFARLLPILGLVILFFLGVWVGLILLVIPGIMLMVAWSVSVAACVVEGTGPIASLTRSAALTKGYRWKIFGIFVLIWIASLIVGLLVGVISYQLGKIANMLASFFWTACWTAYFNSVLVMVYHGLRVAKEGPAVTQMAAGFD